MDVAALKKNYVDTSPTAKSPTDSANQLMSDFSAAVAKRISKTGGTNFGNSKNTLMNAVSAKPAVRAEATPQNESYEPAAPAERADKPAPRERAESTNDHYTDAPAHDDVVQTDAPREAAPDHASSDRGDDTSHKSSNEDQTSSDQSGNGENQQEQHASEQTETGDATTPDGQVAVVQQVNTGEVAKVVGNNAANAETVKAAVADTTGSKQKSQKGGNTPQANLNGQAATQGTDDGSEVLLKDANSKGKATSGQAQNSTNTHVKAEAQATVEKGPTLAQQQAADLAKKVGSDQNLNVKVNVTKQSDELVSQPSANLAGKANLKTDGESLTPTAAQASTKGQAQPATAQNSGGQNGADAQSQNQQQAQLQAAQADAAKIASNATEAKTAQNATANATTQTAKVGGAESASAPLATAAPSGPAQPTQQAAATEKPQPMPQKQPETPATEQVKIQISKALNDGMDRIRIQLKPAHLGRVDIQLELGQDGRVTAVVSADNKETMDLLKQDSSQLERALREAGLNLNSGDLSFNMRGENGNGAGDQDVAQGKSAPAEPILEPTLDELLQMQAGQPQIISKDRVDITA